VAFLDFDSDRAKPLVFCGPECRATSHEGVKHKPALGGVGRKEGGHRLYGLLVRVPGVPFPHPLDDVRDPALGWAVLPLRQAVGRLLRAAGHAAKPLAVLQECEVAHGAKPDRLWARQKTEAPPARKARSAKKRRPLPFTGRTEPMVAYPAEARAKAP